MEKNGFYQDKMWIGLDRLGNELPQATDDKGSWWKPIFLYEQIRLDPKDLLAKCTEKARRFGIPGIKRQ
jgi:hypothetical protein